MNLGLNLGLNLCGYDERLGCCPWWGVCPHSYQAGDPACPINGDKVDYIFQTHAWARRQHLDIEAELLQLERDLDRIKETNNQLERESMF